MVGVSNCGTGLRLRFDNSAKEAWLGVILCRLCGMSMDSELQKHYTLLLGSPWEVKNVDLNLEGKKVEVELGWQWGAAAKCPECGRECSIHDCAPERTWRHLDMMQFMTLIRARTPRADCPEHGVKTMQVPWAAPQGRFTLLFAKLKHPAQPPYKTLCDVSQSPVLRFSAIY